MSEGYKLYGGTGVEINPLEVSEDGTYTAPMGKAFNPVKVSGGGSTGGGVFIVTATEDGDTGALTLDKTCREIISALNAKTPTFIQMAWGNGWGETPALYDSLYLIPLNGVEYTDVDVQSGASTGVARYLFYALCASLNEPGTTVYLFSAASTEDYPVVAD